MSVWCKIVYSHDNSTMQHMLVQDHYSLANTSVFDLAAEKES